jgi:hypothetical protein
MCTLCLMLRQQQPNKIMVAYKVPPTKAFNWTHRLQGRGLRHKIRNLYNYPPPTNILPLKEQRLKLSPAISCTVQGKERNSLIKPQQRLISYRRRRTLSVMFTYPVLPPRGSKSPQGNLLYLLAQAKVALLMRWMVLRTQGVPVETTWMLLILGRIIKARRDQSSTTYR